ncbi:hypothetical protein JTB14_020597 [Gonioctena quinquepunctata]|nr:hypothetical protein JTB14_020597 [Gonioctena quinquepunctata]
MLLKVPVPQNVTVQARGEVPYGREERGEAMENCLEPGFTSRMSVKEAEIPKDAQEIRDQLDSPTCEPDVDIVVKKDIEWLDV